jgi:transposase-like protein
MSKRALRVFSREFKHRMVRRLAGGERVAALAEEAGVKPQFLYDWRAAYPALGVAGLSRKRGGSRGGGEIARRRALPSQDAHCGA